MDGGNGFIGCVSVDIDFFGFDVVVSIYFCFGWNDFFDNNVFFEFY